MSTGGKVLVVLTTLMTLVWMGLMSMVAKLNSNHGDAVKKGADAIAALEKQVADANVEFRNLAFQVDASHATNDNDRQILRLEYNDLEKTLAELQENLSRMTNLTDTLKKAVEETAKNTAIRRNEIAAHEKKLAETKDAVEKSKQNNSDLLQQLADLRNQFMKISEENRAMSTQLGTSSPYQDASAGRNPLISVR